MADEKHGRRGWAEGGGAVAIVKPLAFTLNE